MGIALGNSTPSTFKLGSAQVTAIYLGTQSVWTSVLPVITITTQPTTQTTSGTTASFTVSASVTESATLSYQWQRNATGNSSWADISGGTSATLSLSSLSSGSNQYDKYRCVVSATGGATSVTSSEAELLFFTAGEFFFEPNSAWSGIGFSGSGTSASPYTKAGGYSGPSSQATIRVTSSGSVRFSSSGSSESPGFFYISKNGSEFYRVGSLTTSTGIANVESVVFVAAGDTIAIGNSGLRVYDLSVYGGSSVSSITITSQPSAQTASSGAATFSVSATNSASETLTYQWQRQALGTGSYANISGATSSTLSLTGLTNASNNGDNYRCVVSSATASSVTSNAAALTVAAGGTGLSISRDNGSSTFSGSGTSASPYSRSTPRALSESDGLSHYAWTAGASGTVYVSFAYSDDSASGESRQIKKNGTSVSTSTGSASAVAVSVSSGDVITISATGDASQQFFTNVSVYAT